MRWILIVIFGYRFYRSWFVLQILHVCGSVDCCDKYRIHSMKLIWHVIIQRWTSCFTLFYFLVTHNVKRFRRINYPSIKFLFTAFFFHFIRAFSIKCHDFYNFTLNHQSHKLLFDRTVQLYRSCRFGLFIEQMKNNNKNSVSFVFNYFESFHLISVCFVFFSGCLHRHAKIMNFTFNLFIHIFKLLRMWFYVGGITGVTIKPTQK